MKAYLDDLQIIDFMHKKESFAEASKDCYKNAITLRNEGDYESGFYEMQSALYAQIKLSNLLLEEIIKLKSLFLTR